MHLSLSLFIFSGIGGGTHSAQKITTTAQYTRGKRVLSLLCFPDT